MSEWEGLLEIPELGCGEGLPFPQDVSPPSLFYPLIIPISQICSQSNSPRPGSCTGLPEIGKEKGSEQGRQRLEKLGLATPGKGWGPQEEGDGLARRDWEDA